MLVGYVDGCDDGVLTGWAARSGNLEPVAVEVLHDGAVVGRTSAGLFREDLRVAGYGVGRHGFEFIVPASIRDRRSYVLTVREELSQVLLAQSPLAVEEQPSRVLIGRRLRRFLADQYFHGCGLEIGPLHRPMPVPDGVQVTYADSFPTETLRELWSPEVDGHEIVPIDLVVDATGLAGIADGSFDFVVASHVLEHLENPVRAVRNALRILRPGGALFLALPDRRFTFDVERPPTTIAHVLRDYCGGAGETRRGHYEEWVRSVEHLAGEACSRRVADLEARLHPIHFHVWTPGEFSTLLQEVSRLMPYDFEVDFFKANGAEGVWVLQRR